MLKLSEYLLENWNLETHDKFIKKLSEKINQISFQPESCPQSSAYNELFICVVTKQTTFYYRIKKDVNEIEIITLFDTRQHPDKLKKDIK